MEQRSEWAWEQIGTECRVGDGTELYSERVPSTPPTPRILQPHSTASTRHIAPLQVLATPLNRAPGFVLAMHDSDLCSQSPFDAFAVGARLARLAGLGWHA